jgi:hypothetical protein
MANPLGRYTPMTYLCCCREGQHVVETENPPVCVEAVSYLLGKGFEFHPTPSFRPYKEGVGVPFPKLKSPKHLGICIRSVGVTI